MARQFSISARNDALSAMAARIGASPILKLRTGAPPANCAAADTGTVIASMTLPASPFAAPSNGSMALAGTWQDVSADAAGTVGHFRLYASDGVTCHDQGTVTLTGAGGDMTMDNTNIQPGQQVNCNSYTLTMAGA